MEAIGDALEQVVRGNHTAGVQHGIRALADERPLIRLLRQRVAHLACVSGRASLLSAGLGRREAYELAESARDAPDEEPPRAG